MSNVFVIGALEEEGKVDRPGRVLKEITGQIPRQSNYNNVEYGGSKLTYRKG